MTFISVGLYFLDCFHNLFSLWLELVKDITKNEPGSEKIAIKWKSSIWMNISILKMSFCYVCQWKIHKIELKQAEMH